MVNKPCVRFLRVWTKKPISRKTFRKPSKNLIRKLRNMHYFNRFFTKFNKACIIYLRVWTKNTSNWKLAENVRKFWKKTQNLVKFSENFEIFWWKFYRKLYFFIFSKICYYLSMNRAFGNTTIILQQFLRFRGEGSAPFPLAAPLNTSLPAKAYWTISKWILDYFGPSNKHWNWFPFWPVCRIRGPTHFRWF